jgi:hypothetical protein
VVTGANRVARPRDDRDHDGPTQEVRMQYSISRWRVATLALGLAMVACHEPIASVQERSESGQIKAELAIVAGDQQEGMAGRWLSDAFAVRVSDAAGTGIPDVTVSWAVVTGRGMLCFPASGPASQCQAGTYPLRTLSARDGRAEVRFRPAELGRGTVTATILGSPASTVTFSTNTVGVEISLSSSGDCSDPAEFSGPDGVGLVEVPVGVPVEWELSCGGRIASTSAPVGRDFDSGTLPAGGRFRFVPDVAGQWVYREVVSEVTGRLMAVRAAPADSTAAQPNLAFTSCLEWEWSVSGDDRCRSGGLTVLHFDGSEETLASTPTPDDDPAWSPEGGRIAFSGYRHCDAYDVTQVCAAEIYVMTADGEGVTRLTHGARNHASYGPAWAPDGTRLAFYTWDEAGGFQIYVMRPDGSEAAPLADLHGFQPAWSPDGSRIAFAVQDAGIFIAGADGSAPTQVTHPERFPDATMDTRPSWSPDGRRIAFTRIWTYAAGNSTCQILVMGTDGSNPLQITHDPFCAHSPAWSSDGARIAYLGGVFDEERVWRAAGIWLTDPDGTNAVLLRQFPAWPSRVTWAPLMRPRRRRTSPRTRRGSPAAWRPMPRPRRGQTRRRKVS